jgi:hypothetical protein
LLLQYDAVVMSFSPSQTSYSTSFLHRMQWRPYSRKDYAAFTVGNAPLKAKQGPSANGNVHIVKRSTFLTRFVVVICQLLDYDTDLFFFYQRRKGKLQILRPSKPIRKGMVSQHPRRLSSPPILLIPACFAGDASETSISS